MELTLDYRLDMGAQSQWEIISVSTLAKQHLMYLQESGLFYSGPGYYTTRRGLDSFLIKLTLSGQGMLNYGGQTYSVAPGDFFWIDCREQQDYRTAPDSDHWHVLWLHMWGANTEGYYTLFRQLNQGSPVGHLPETSNLRQIMDMLLQLYSNYSGDLSVDIRSANLLTQLLSGLIETVSATPVAPTLPPAVFDIRTYLQTHYRPSVTLETLSQQFNISKFHLQRSFRRYIGLSPSAYQQKIRLTKAKELLRTTNLSINLVADSVGFESTSAFISAFKKQEGVTPLKYRSGWSSSITP